MYSAQDCAGELQGRSDAEELGLGKCQKELLYAVGAYRIGDSDIPTGQQCGMSILDFEVVNEDGLGTTDVVTGV